MTFKASSTFQISDNIVFRKQSDGNYALLEIDGEGLFQLDDVAAFIWDKIAEGANYSTIIKSLKEDYELTGEENISDVNEFLEELIKKGIVSKE